MNEIVNKFLLAGDKFMSEMNLRQPGFTFSGCGPFTKDEERIQKFKETRDSRYVYQKEQDKACFQHDMAYGWLTETLKISLDEQLLIKYCMTKHLKSKIGWISKRSSLNGLQVF